MRVMVIAKANEEMGKSMANPTPEMLEAFAAMDRFTEELVQAGIFIAAAGLQEHRAGGVEDLGVRNAGARGHA